jgi:hypothetical protein
MAEGTRDVTVFHPVQIDTDFRHPHKRPVLPASVTLAAYEVYCHLYGKQQAMIENGCRGGFSIGEIIGFLYARSFPKAEWQARFDEAIKRQH